MRSTIFACLLGLVGCGEDAVKTPDVDAQTGNRPEPRVIAGGGIGDGAIDGVVNLYVIDDDTRDPIEGAEVQVGGIAGETDADGLFVAEGLVGAQDVVAKAPGMRKEMWVGVNGANVTINLVAADTPTPTSKTLSGAVTGFETVPFTPAPNHVKVAIVGYSQTATLGDAANELATPGGTNMCISPTGTDPCTFSIVTRTGKLALLATILDLDTKGTPESADDTTTILGFAVRQGIDTATASTGQNLSMIADSNTHDVTVDFGTPPSGLTQHGAIVGIQIGDEGILSVGAAFGFTGSPTMKVPKHTALTGGTGYLLTGFAGDGATNPAQSVVLRRGLTGTTLSMGSWLSPPTAPSLTREGGSWSNASGATVHTIELRSGSTRLLDVTVFDSSRTSFDIPDVIALPTSPIDVSVNAIGATGLDVTDFSLDEAVDTVDRLGAQATTIN